MIKLSDFDHLRSEEMIRFREEIVDGVEVVIICYMIATPDLWDKPLAKLCRGITFRKDTGELISHPFHKFFNVNERPDTQLSLIGDIKPEVVVDKVDGSMITPALINNNIYLKTKKSFYSDVAKLAQKEMTRGVRDLSEFLLRRGITPIFEFTHPDTKIVIDYGETPNFTLLAAYSSELAGYLSPGQLAILSMCFGVDLVNRFYGYNSISEIVESTVSYENTEGLIIWHGDEIYKVKTKWYLERHRMLDVRDRDIALMVAEERIDDMIPELLAAQVDMKRVSEIQASVAEEMCALRRAASEYAIKAREVPDGRERAEWINKNCPRLADFVFKMSRDIEVSDFRYLAYWKELHLKQYSLRSISNSMFGGES